MRLPTLTAHFSQRVRVGRYVARRLRRAGLTSLSDDVSRASVALRDAGRAWEDSEGAIQDALADRDAADDALDETAQDARARLAGASATAVREEPFSLIFPKGAGYYTAAPVDEEELRYGELKQRLEAHLGRNDAVRKKAVAAIDAGLRDWCAAAKELDDNRAAASMARTQLERKAEAWDRQLEKAYGAVVAEVGRVRAEAFFPRSRASKKGSEPDAPGGGTGPGPA